MSQKPSIPKGMRDFSPEESSKRNYIFNTIEEVYKSFGFLPIETPVIENLKTLTGKYGDEGDKLLFKILNSGDFLKKVRDESLQKRDLKKISSKITEKGLRYDLTVPFARYVVQHQNEINFPFKRYQIQPVWRADKPQRGRYREFYQCDADVIGSESLLNEAELVQIMDEVFCKLGLKVQIRINNRKILAGLAEVMGHSDKLTEITISLDKLDKMPMDKVLQEISNSGVDNSAIEKLKSFISFGNLDTEDKLDKLKSFLNSSEIGMKGVKEIETLLDYVNNFDLINSISIDTSLARGLDYYTGSIFEVISEEVKMGSICGGGRYDDLTGVFGLKNMSGVGISFGADRIYDVLHELNRFPKNMTVTTKVMIVNFGNEEEKYALKVLKKLRDNKINAELYPDSKKMKKQFSYADKKNIPFVMMIGENEIKSGKYTLKDMHSGDQEALEIDSVINKLK